MTSVRMGIFKNRVPGIVFGGDYNPEQWPRSVWDEDMRLMRQANVRLVSLGVFSWSALEPSEGLFTFEWLDEIMDRLAQIRVFVNLATPNNVPPAWLSENYPETRPADITGTRFRIGSRGHFCPSSEVYRDRSRRIARRLGERYADHPALVMWHLGNEYGARCYCGTCDIRFRTWLQDRYQSLTRLNEVWATTVWGQVYSDWAQVHVPQPVLGWINPARDLDFNRFVSEVQRDLVVTERDLLRSINPDIPVTTNFYQRMERLDTRRWARDIDVVGFDMYPDPVEKDSLIEAAFHYDLVRGIGSGQPWMLLEQAVGAVSQFPENLTKRPGRMRLGSLQAVARGSDSVMFFQWRAARAGQEKFHSAMLPHGGTDTRTWREVESLGNELALLAGVAGGTTHAHAALVWDHHNWWATKGPAHPRHDYDYLQTVLEHYETLWRANITTNIVHLDDDLSHYRILVVPNQYAMTSAQAANIRTFVSTGGHVVLSYFSDIVDENVTVREDGYLSQLQDVFGVRLLDFSIVAEGRTAPVIFLDEQGAATVEGTVSLWQDDLVPVSASVLARYVGSDLDGQAAVTINHFGEGTAIYIGGKLDAASRAFLLQQALGRAGVTAPHIAPDNVEVIDRFTDDAVYLFVLNHGETDSTFLSSRSGHELLGGYEVEAGEALPLPASGVLVIRSQR